VIDSDFSAIGTGSIGIQVTDTAQIYQTRASGAGYDLQVDTASTAQVDDVTLVNATQNIVGTLDPLRSDPCLMHSVIKCAMPSIDNATGIIT
jgi:hypothetical protein